jgi:hypothetical protein
MQICRFYFRFQGIADMDEPVAGTFRTRMAHRDQFLIGPDVVHTRGQAEVGRAAEPAASVENDPLRTSGVQ